MELEQIYYAVKRVFNVDFLIDCRKTQYKEARMMFTKIAFDNEFNRYEIADFINRDRSVTYNSMIRFSQYFDTEKQFRNKYENCIRMLNEHYFKIENEKQKRKEFLINELKAL